MCSRGPCFPEDQQAPAEAARDLPVEDKEARKKRAAAAARRAEMVARMLGHSDVASVRLLRRMESVPLIVWNVCLLEFSY